MKFEFATAGRILFGRGSASEIGPAAKQFGERVFVVSGRTRRTDVSATATFTVTREPTVDMVREGANTAREGGCDVVVAIGGGSVIDAAKAIAALIANGGDPLDYLEVIGRGRPLTKPSIPFVAVPTTAGTGTEVTRNAVLASTEHRVKASLRSPHMLPRIAIIDPELTLGLPPAITASTGLDALTQVVEPYVSVRANAMTDMFCLEGMRHAAASLRRAYADGSDIEARTGMAFASLMGGLALANAGLGAVHGFAAPIGGSFDAPHGAVCAALLPHVIEANILALRERAPESPALRRYETVACILTRDANAIAEHAEGAAAQLCADLHIPPLREYGVGEADIEPLCEKAAQASSMKGNPIALTRAELQELLRRAI